MSTFILKSHQMKLLTMKIIGVHFIYFFQFIGPYGIDVPVKDFINLTVALPATKNLIHKISSGITPRSG